MTKNDLKYLKNWFSDYTASFYSSDEEDQRNIALKVEHTYNVCENMAVIVNALNLHDNDKRLAETVALFHDLGRFQQYSEYKTFRDADSVSHGRLGAETLIKENILKSLPGDERRLVVYTVRFHGAFALPDSKDQRKTFYLKLVRDADKIDIFRVFIEYYESPEEARASATAFGVPDSPEYSKLMLACISNKQVASYSKIRTENDFKLMKLSWVYAMYFKESIRLLQEKDYLNRIIDKLPQTDEILSAISVLRQYITDRLDERKKE